MERKYNEHDLEEAIRRTAPADPPRPDFAEWREKHPEALRVGKAGVGARADYDRSFLSVLRFGRTIMKTRRRRFGLAAAAVVALTVAFIVPGTNTAWSVEQTIAAMKKIETLHITGQNVCRGKLVDFDCWVRLQGTGSDALRLRYQCGCERKTTIVVQGDTVYAYSPVEKAVRIMDGSTIKDLQYWYEGAQFSPWLTGKVLETLKLIGRGWEQTTEIDPNTGKEQIIVTCNHPPSNISALLVVDPQSKLVRRAKIWRNLSRAGGPEFDAQTIVYNPEVADDLFEFEIPPGVTVVDQTLFDRAEQLFHKERKYAEAIELYWQVYNTYPTLNIGEESLMMIGICHDWLRRPEKAIEVFQKALREFPDLKGWIEATWFYLGTEYRQIGQKEKALEAFENCLATGAGVRDPDRFPLKNAREIIAQIKGETTEDSQAQALFDQGENLFHNEKKYAEAMKIYWQVYHAYPHLNTSETALMMIGLCHGRLGQPDEAIAVFEKAVREYADLKGWIDATYYYLGRDYQRQGQTAKALEAFENCLRAGEDVRDPETFPLKDAREAIAKIKGQ
jgi:tetratricopeptide (TPR) repeat protein